MSMPSNNLSKNQTATPRRLVLQIGNIGPPNATYRKNLI